MKKVFFILLAIWMPILCIPVYFYLDEKQLEEVCVRLYMTGGIVRDKCYDLPKESKIYLSENRLLVYKCKPYWICGVHVLKREVIDYEIIRKK